MQPEEQRTASPRATPRARSYVVGVSLGGVLFGLTALALLPLVDPARAWLREVTASETMMPTANASAHPAPRSASMRSASTHAQGAQAAPFGPSVGARVERWSQTLDPALRSRLTIPLPETVRPLFPHAGDSLVVDPETVWLARCIYSESNRPREQELVAWVVRNRVVAGYRGKVTIRDVVLDPYQFSAFNSGHPRRAYYLSLLPEHTLAPWQRALRIAAYVRRAPWEKRPFSVRVRHFYSEISMDRPYPPRWAQGETPIRPDRPYPIDPVRFRFFALDEPMQFHWPGPGAHSEAGLQLAEALGPDASEPPNGIAERAPVAHRVN